MPVPQQKWAIIGGGFLGMTLALRLAQQGKAVTLFEASPSLGGLAGTWRLGDVIWDRHYHVSLSSDGYLRSLLDALKISVERRSGDPCGLWFAPCDGDHRQRMRLQKIFRIISVLENIRCMEKIVPAV